MFVFKIGWWVFCIKWLIVLFNICNRVYEIFEGWKEVEWVYYCFEGDDGFVIFFDLKWDEIMKNVFVCVFLFCMLKYWFIEIYVSILYVLFKIVVLNFFVIWRYCIFFFWRILGRRLWLRLVKGLVWMLGIWGCLCIIILFIVSCVCMLLCEKVLIRFFRLFLCVYCVY